MIVYCEVEAYNLKRKFGGSVDLFQINASEIKLCNA